MGKSEVERVMRSLYPEVGAGGFSRIDGTMQYYQRVNALVKAEHVVLDIGAGRGHGQRDDPSSYRRHLRTLKGRCAKIIGIDVDKAIFENPSLDEAHLIVDNLFPIASNSVDIIVSDHTFEHVDDAESFCREIDRVLKPGGWLCARTPNKYGYVSLGANLVPNMLHVKFLKVLQPNRKDFDVFPTRYRLNTISTLIKYLPPTKWNHYNYTWDPEPAYFGSSKILWQIMRLVSAITPRPFKAVLMIFCQKNI